MKTKLLLITLITSLVLLSACAPLTTTPQDTTAQTQGVEATQAQTEATETPQETTAQTAGEIATEEETTPTVQVTNGTFSTDTHSVIQKDGVYYLNFADGNELSAGGSGDYSSEAGFSVASVKELRTKIITNTFDRAELDMIKGQFSKNQNGIEIFNIDKMYEAVFPEGMKAQGVYWKGGAYYSLHVSANGNNEYGKSLDTYINLLSKESYEESVNGEFKDYFSGVRYEKIVSQESGEWEGLPCETYVYTTSVARLKVVLVELPAELEGQVRYIVIKYRLEHKNEGMLDMKVSDTVPVSVRLLGEYEGQGFELFLTPFSSAPTLEFLTSFGITPYVE